MTEINNSDYKIISREQILDMYKSVEEKYLKHDEELLYEDFPERSVDRRGGMRTVMVWFKLALKTMMEV